MTAPLLNSVLSGGSTVRNPFRIVFLLLALAGTNAALAQQSIVYSVEGWGKLSTRDDGKGVANSFQWAVTVPAPAGTGAGAGSGKPSVQDSVLVIPVGDAAVQFAQAAMRGEHLRQVLVEFPLKGGNPRGPAPFAMRLTDVFVSSVSLGKSGDGGPGAAEIKLNAARVEMYTSQQDPKSGQPYGSRKAGIDVKANKAF
jgi:type VI protein secretion system component Hcp